MRSGPILPPRVPAPSPASRTGGRGSALILIVIVVALLGAPACATTTTAYSIPRGAPEVRSAAALIQDDHGRVLFQKNADQQRPIASITKLMTAMVVLDTRVALQTPIGITDEDRDRLRHSRSRLIIGEAVLPRYHLMNLALMSSDNRAASALSRTTLHGGTPNFVAAMNGKARKLGMTQTTFADASGLDGGNRSTARDLARMVRAAAEYPLIREASTRSELQVAPVTSRPPLDYRNTNPLVRDARWDVEVSKTGFINEAGYCLVMQAWIGERRLSMIFLGADARLTPVGDANRVRTWLLGPEM